MNIHKYIALSLAGLIFFQSLLPNATGISESMKLGSLVSHYQQSSEHELDDLSTFLWKHYASDSKHKDGSEHSKLPNIHSSFTVIVNCTNLIIENTSWIFTYRNESSRLIYSNSYQFDFLKSLLNPPQVA